MKEIIFKKIVQDTAYECLCYMKNTVINFIHTL